MQIKWLGKSSCVSLDTTINGLTEFMRIANLWNVKSYKKCSNKTTQTEHYSIQQH